MDNEELNRCGSCNVSCCNDIRDTIACLCTLEQEFECVEEALGHCDNHLKSKVLTCVILRQINQLETKLDRIIRCLECPP